MVKRWNEKAQLPDRHSKCLYSEKLKSPDGCNFVLKPEVLPSQTQGKKTELTQAWVTAFWLQTAPAWLGLSQRFMCSICPTFPLLVRQFVQSVSLIESNRIGLFICCSYTAVLADISSLKHHVMFCVMMGWSIRILCRLGSCCSHAAAQDGKDFRDPHIQERVVWYAYDSIITLFCCI